MNLFFQKHHRLLFYSSWLLLALAQAASTELIADEAYYWVYSRFPAWGYFDHPPMIAFLIKSGYAIFHNELGVRLVCALLSTFTILITESLIERKDPFLFYTIILSIGVLQIAGFLAVPDTPLLFFTALFFYTYRSFIKNTNWKNTLLLAIAISLLFYTKYHGLLIVLFAFLSNIKLFTRWQTWMAGFFVLILYAPHILWQWDHDWVSFRYHLFESNVSAYKFSYTTDYLLGQILLAGPLAGFILFPAALMYKVKTQTEKALKFTLIGIYLIFLISSFRGKVEVNWTMPALVPLIVLSHQFIIDKISWVKPLKIIAFVSLLLIIAGRIYLVVDIGPDNSTKGRFRNKAWAKTIAEKTGDVPVVFYNSYQRASLFWFYSGKSSHSHNSYTDRKSNYNFWPTESNLLGKEVFIADIYGMQTFSDSVKTKKGWVGFTYDSMYSALGGIRMMIKRKNIDFDTAYVTISISYEVPRVYQNFLRSHNDINGMLYVGIFKGKEIVKEFNLEITAKDIARQRSPFAIAIARWLPHGSYDIRLGIKAKNYLITHNSNTIHVRF
ncbi:MAG TPA: glycosyltransferase family 39 protein [Chitinophagaceae bacterium]|nr:glycosyltransferase family 39 protein [Chitinophagaceae bacterium]